MDSTASSLGRVEIALSCGGGGGGGDGGGDGGDGGGGDGGWDVY